jgi:hypothetical protein
MHTPAYASKSRIHTNAQAHTHARARTRTRARAHACSQKRMHACSGIRTHTGTQARARVLAYTPPRTHALAHRTCTYTHTPAHTPHQRTADPARRGTPRHTAAQSAPLRTRAADPSPLPSIPDPRAPPKPPPLRLAGPGEQGAGDAGPEEDSEGVPVASAQSRRPGVIRRLQRQLTAWLRARG